MKVHLDHIGIAVRDLAAALAFYRDALGLEVEGTEAVGSQGVRVHFLPAGGPGGQNVNKVSSAVKLRFDVRSSQRSVMGPNAAACAARTPAPRIRCA